MAWLLDTNAWIHYLKHGSSPIAQRLQRQSPTDIVLCSIVRAELLYGALKYGNPDRRLAIVREAIAPFASLPFDDSTAERYAGIRHELERSGAIIGPHDLLIAAICMAHGCTLVTGNTREFSRVSGLSIEDWLNPS